MIRTNTKVALYARFSSDNQRTESIDAQLRAMKTYCKAHNYIITKIYTDEAKSATTDKRPAFQQMIADSTLHLFTMVLVHKLDRFARNRYDSAVYKRELKKNGVIVCSVLENLDDSPESIMMEAVLEGMSEYYSQNLAREVMKGMRETALQCKHTGGKPPLGYDVDTHTKKLTINPYEAETVQLIFDMYSKGHGYSAILDELHFQDRRTKKGTAFMKNSLYSILTNPKYQGVYIFNRSSAKSIAGTRNTHLYKDDEEIIMIDGGCPQIVPKDVYRKVQDRITANKNKGGKHNSKELYLLSGKVFCKECGKAMVGNKRYSGRNKALYVTYRCPTHKYACTNKEINRDYLERYVKSLLEKEIFNVSALKRLSKRIESKSATSTPKQQGLQMEQELKDVNTALQNVADAVASGLISDALVDKLNKLEERKQNLETQLQSAQSSTEVSFTPIDINLILSEYTSICQSPALPSYKEFISSFINRIEVGKYIVDITLKTGLDVCPMLDTTYPIRRQEVYEYRPIDK